MGSKKGDRERRDQNEKMKNGFGKIADPMRERERERKGGERSSMQFVRITGWFWERERKGVV